MTTTPPTRPPRGQQPRPTRADRSLRRRSRHRRRKAARVAIAEPPRTEPHPRQLDSRTASTRRAPRHHAHHGPAHHAERGRSYIRIVVNPNDAIIVIRSDAQQPIGRQRPYTGFASRDAVAKLRLDGKPTPRSWVARMTNRPTPTGAGKSASGWEARHWSDAMPQYGIRPIDRSCGSYGPSHQVHWIQAKTLEWTSDGQQGTTPITDNGGPSGWPP